MVQIIEDTKNAIIATVKGTDDVLSALRTAVTHQVTGLAQDAAGLTGSLADVAEGSVDAAMAVGADIGKAAVSIVEGIVEAAGSVGVSTAEATEAALTGVVRATGKVGGETLEAVKHALGSAASLPGDVVKKVLG